MTVVVTARGETVDAEVDSRFGRTAFLLQIDTASGTCQVHSNRPNLQAAQGAGIQTAQRVADLAPDALITGNLGPKAFRVLQAAGIRAYRCKAGTAAEAVRHFQDGNLTELTAANVEGHWV